MKNIKSIHQKLKKIDKKLYIVGGFCREKILRKPNSGDIDLVTDVTPDEMKKVLKIAGEIGKKYGTCIVSEGGESFELTTFRKDIGSINFRKPAEVEFTDSLEEDSQRRDFTCNAIYFDVETEEFIDFHSGIEDVQQKIIRFVGNPRERIHEDALRILRCIRFKNKYNFQFASPEYIEIFQENIEILKNISMERIKQELDKILTNPNNVQALEDLKQIGFLKIFLPELDRLDQFGGNKHHLEGDIWIHTKMCVQEMNQIILREKITGERKLLLLWSILLHDIGKGPTYSVGKDGESHYYNHENVGAEMFKNNLAKRLLFPKNFEKEIYFLIREHLRLFMIPKMKKLKSRKLMMHEYFPDLILLGEADNKGRIPAKLDYFEEIASIYKDFQKLLETKTFFTGKDVLEKFPDLEGKKIGEKLEQWNNRVLLED
ncbi:CCA tRNA nucleotidyltransferase [Candidatus Gracilibacteria bacterium]|nr:CCA tRNA nucleotidyltransferase [Candidatus Gracilibacteria bacterium]